MKSYLSRMGLATVSCALLFSLIAAPETFVENNAFERAITDSRALLQERTTGGDYPGFSVAVAVNGELVWAEGFGYADIESGRPVTQQTQFRIGSTSKSITAVALGLLIDKNAINVDARVQTYVPYFPEKAYPITPRQLAGNLSGIRHYRGMESFNSKPYSTLREGLTIFQEYPLLFEPGTQFGYSSYGFNLLGAVIEGASGTSYIEFIQKEILDPLGMGDSSPDYATREMPNRTSFYRNSKDGPKKAGFVDDSYKWPSGGLLSTPTDMVTFGSALLGPGLLSENAMRTLFTSQKLNSGKETGYGMGFRINNPTDDRPHRAVHHGGSSTGGKSMLFIYPDAKIVVSTLTNTNTYPERDSDARAIADAFANAK